MANMLSRKCENCGGELEAINNSILKCPYCGSTFTFPKNPAPIADRAAQEVINTGENISPQNIEPIKKKRSGCGTLLILLFLFVGIPIIYAIINANTSNRYSADDIARIDSVSGLAGISNVKHIKRTNPENKILITSKPFKHQELNHLLITVKNLTNNGTITSLKFTYQLLDKHGINMVTADMDSVGFSDKTIRPGETCKIIQEITDSWAIYSAPKSARIILKEIDFDNNTEWDYDSNNQ